MTVPQAESMFDRVQRERKLLYAAFDNLERGEPVDFELFRGVLGVVQESEPITWQQLQAALALGTDEAMGVLGRTVRQIQQYYRERDNVGMPLHSALGFYGNANRLGAPAAHAHLRCCSGISPVSAGQMLAGYSETVCKRDRLLVQPSV